MLLDVNNIQTPEQRKHCNSAIIYLDSVEIKWVVEVDDEVGYVVRYKTVSGKFTVANDRIEVEKLYGKVEIKFKE